MQIRRSLRTTHLREPPELHDTFSRPGLLWDVRLTDTPAPQSDRDALKIVARALSSNVVLAEQGLRDLTYVRSLAMYHAWVPRIVRAALRRRDVAVVRRGLRATLSLGVDAALHEAISPELKRLLINKDRGVSGLAWELVKKYHRELREVIQWLEESRTILLSQATQRLRRLSATQSTVALAEDVVQDLFAKRLPSLVVNYDPNVDCASNASHRARFPVYLERALENECRSAGRKERRLRTHEVTGLSAALLAENPVASEAMNLRLGEPDLDGLQGPVRDLVETLADPMREAILLRHSSDDQRWPRDTSSTVRKRYSVALGQLAKRIAGPFMARLTGDRRQIAFGMFVRRENTEAISARLWSQRRHVCARISCAHLNDGQRMGLKRLLSTQKTRPTGTRIELDTGAGQEAISCYSDELCALVDLTSATMRELAYDIRAYLDEAGVPQ